MVDTMQNETKVSKWGHSLAIRIPQSVAKQARIHEGDSYNSKSGLALVCPVTNQKKGYPFEVALPHGSGVSGVILADYIKSVDWNIRLPKRISKCPPEAMEEIRAKVLPLLGS